MKMYVAVISDGTCNEEFEYMSNFRKGSVLNCADLWREIRLEKNNPENWFVVEKR